MARQKASLDNDEEPSQSEHNECWLDEKLCYDIYTIYFPEDGSAGGCQAEHIYRGDICNAIASVASSLQKTPQDTVELEVWATPLHLIGDDHPRLLNGNETESNWPGEDFAWPEFQVTFTTDITPTAQEARIMISVRKHNVFTCTRTLGGKWIMQCVAVPQEECSTDVTQEETTKPTMEQQKMNQETKITTTEKAETFKQALTNVLGMQAGAWKDAAQIRAGEIIVNVMNKLARKSMGTFATMWIGKDEPSNVKNHVFNVVLASLAALGANMLNNERYRRLANAAVVAAYSGALRQVPVEKWLSQAVESIDVRKAEALLDGKDTLALDQSAQLTMMAERLAAMEAELAAAKK